MSSATSAQADAIMWLVELRSGEAGPQEQRDFAAWLAESQSHREAWQRLTGALDSTFGAPGVARRGGAQAVNATLTRATGFSQQRRRALRGALGIAGVGVGSAWMARSSGLLPDLIADLHTTTAQRREYALQDGSRLLLDARSSADHETSARGQRVTLRTGQLIAGVRSMQHAPLVLASKHVEARLLQGRCLLRCEAQRTLVAALGATVTVAPRLAGSAAMTLGAGEAAWFSQAGVHAVDAADVPLLATWERGLLAVRDERLGEVVARLQAYRNGLLRITDDAAALRVSGTYPLDDSDAALQALADTLPVDVRRYTGGWLVRIERSA